MITVKCDFKAGDEVWGFANVSFDECNEDIKEYIKKSLIPRQFIINYISFSWDLKDGKVCHSMISARSKDCKDIVRREGEESSNFSCIWGKTPYGTLNELIKGPLLINCFKTKKEALLYKKERKNILIAHLRRDIEIKKGAILDNTKRIEGHRQFIIQREEIIKAIECEDFKAQDN